MRRTREQKIDSELNKVVYRDRELFEMTEEENETVTGLFHSLNAETSKNFSVSPNQINDFWKELSIKYGFKLGSQCSADPNNDKKFYAIKILTTEDLWKIVAKIFSEAPEEPIEDKIQLANKLFKIEKRPTV